MLKGIIGFVFVCVCCYSVGAMPFEPAASALEETATRPTLTFAHGLWEGITGDNAHVIMLEHDHDANVRVWKANIPSGLRRIDRFQVLPANVFCSSAYCELSFTFEEDQTYRTRLVITPYMDDDWMVLSMTTTDAGKPLLSDSYLLRKRQSRSTVKSFIDFYRPQKERLARASNNDWNGFWIGVKEDDALGHQKRLVVLEMTPDQGIRYLPADSMHYVPEDAKQHYLFAQHLVEKGTSDNQLNIVLEKTARHQDKLELFRLAEGLLKGTFTMHSDSQVIATGALTFYKVVW